MKTLLLLVSLMLCSFVDQVRDHHADLKDRRVSIVRTSTNLPVNSVFVIRDYPERGWLSFTGLENNFYFDISYNSRVEIENGAYVVYYGENQENTIAFRLIN